MAPLKNIRHETFAREIATRPRTGRSLAECYIASGYKADGHAAEANASRLWLRNAEIKRRVAEITAPAVRKARVTVESLLSELQTTIDDARAAKQHGTVVSCLTLAAKLVGLLTDRLEVGHPGEFAGLQTPEEVRAMILEELGPDAVVLLDQARAADQARLVVSAR